MENRMEGPRKNRTTIWPSSSTSGYWYWKDTYISMFTATLFTIVNNLHIWLGNIQAGTMLLIKKKNKTWQFDFVKWNPSLICCCPSQVLNLQYLRIQIKRQRKLICQMEHEPADFLFWSRPDSFLSVISASVKTSCMCKKPLLYQIALSGACLKMFSSRTSLSVAEDAAILNRGLNPRFIAINA